MTDSNDLTLSPSMMERLHACWDHIARHRAGEARDAVTEALQQLSTFVDAQNAYWLGSVRVSDSSDGDPLNGWRPRAVRYLHCSDQNRTFARTAMRDCEAGAVDESIAANARQAGVPRARLLRELVSPDWYASSFYQMAYRERGIQDVIFVATPVNAEAESFFGFFRVGDRPPFAIADRDLLAHAVRGLGSIHRDAMLSEGLMIARAPLTPTERRVMPELLTGRSEKEIAFNLGMRPRSLHHHVTRILRKFGVNNRTGLMSLWLGRS